MDLPLYQIDAFARGVFTGNPAAVVPLDDWLPDETLQAIALENNLSETAYIVSADDGWDLRWFTPVREVALCGHATLASAHAIREFIDPGAQTIRFHTRRAGVLEIACGTNDYRMTFPAFPPAPCDPPPGLDAIVGAPFEAVLRAEYAPGEDDMLVVLQGDEAALTATEPDIAGIATLDTRGLILTAKGREVDFVSRYFAPRAGIPEDPVTGSAHCVLTPYWAARLGKNEMTAIQMSARRGWLGCALDGDRVHLTGQAATYMTGTIRV